MSDDPAPLLCPADCRFMPTSSRCSRASACSRSAAAPEGAEYLRSMGARVVTVEGDASRSTTASTSSWCPRLTLRRPRRWSALAALLAERGRLVVAVANPDRGGGGRRLLRAARRAGAALPAGPDAGCDPVSGLGRGRVRRRGRRAADRFAAGEGRPRAARGLRRGGGRRAGDGPRLCAGAAAVRADRGPASGRRGRRRRRRCCSKGRRSRSCAAACGAPPRTAPRWTPRSASCGRRWPKPTSRS